MGKLSHAAAQTSPGLRGLRHAWKAASTDKTGASPIPAGDLKTPRPRSVHHAVPTALFPRLPLAPPMHPSHGSRSLLTRIPEPWPGGNNRLTRLLRRLQVIHLRSLSTTEGRSTSRKHCQGHPNGLPRLHPRASAEGVPRPTPASMPQTFPAWLLRPGHLLSCRHWGPSLASRWDPPVSGLCTPGRGSG